MAVELAGLAHGRGVDDRQELDQVLDQHAVEERLVAVLEGGKADVFLEVVGLGPDVLELEGDLLLDGEARVGEQPPEAEPIALLPGERGTLIEQGIAKRASRDSTSLQGIVRPSGCAVLGTDPSPWLSLREDWGLLGGSSPQRRFHGEVPAIASARANRRPGGSPDYDRSWRTDQRLRWNPVTRWVKDSL